MTYNSKSDISQDNFINSVSFDNITKQNLSTYINKYLCDTIYILQVQLNSIISEKNLNKYSFIKTNNNNMKNNSLNEINMIRIINNSLEKEIFYLNNNKKEELSKLMNILCKRNELLNTLMIHYYEKERMLEKREKILNEKRNVQNRRKSWDKININQIKDKKINFYIENIKKNNEYYNNKRFSKFINNDKENKNKKKKKSTLNKSYDAISINNIDTSCSYNNNYEGNYTNYDFKYLKNSLNRNIEFKSKLRKTNSVSSVINRDSIINFCNKYTYIKLKDKIQLNKLNLDKLNNIISNIYLLNN